MWPAPAVPRGVLRAALLLHPPFEGHRFGAALLGRHTDFGTTAAWEDDGPSPGGSVALMGGPVTGRGVVQAPLPPGHPDVSFRPRCHATARGAGRRAPSAASTVKDVGIRLAAAPTTPDEYATVRWASLSRQ